MQRYEQADENGEGAVKTRRPRWVRYLLRLALGATVLALALAEAFPASAPAPQMEQRPDTDWRELLDGVDRALAVDDVKTALLAWEAARRAARVSPDWRATASVADAYLRIGDAVEFRRAFVRGARDTYLEALERARRAVSPAGALRIALALVPLDDRAAVEGAIEAACEMMAARETASDARTRRGCQDQPAASTPRAEPDVAGRAS